MYIPFFVGFLLSRMPFRVYHASDSSVKFVKFVFAKNKSYLVTNVSFAPFRVGEVAVKVTLPACLVLRRMHCM